MSTRCRHVVLVVLVVLASIAWAAAPEVAPAAPPGPRVSSFESIGGCFAAQKHVLLAFVIDESASLGDAAQLKPGNDPTARRVTAAQVAIDGIANLASQGTTVDVLLTGFSDDLHVYNGWQRLDAMSRTTIEQQLDAFRARNQGRDTDFYNAIAGVQRELARRVTATRDRSDPCELVLLFTDGRFDIDTHVAKPYEPNADAPKDVKVAEGIAALCAADGPMQRLRNDGARTMTLALTDPASSVSEQPDRAFLERLANGDCAVPGSQYGAAFDVTNAADLVGQFDAIATRLRGGTQLPGACEGTQTVPVVGALSGLHIFADAGAASGDIVLTPPGRTPIRISPRDGRTSALSGVALKATATGNRFVVIEATPAPGAAVDAPPWSGSWTVQFARPGDGARCQLFVFEAWRPLLREMSLTRGGNATFAFEIVDADGKPAPAGSLPSDARVSAILAEPGTTGEAVPLTVRRVGSHYEARYTLPNDFAGQMATVTATLHLRLAGADVASSPSATKVRVQTPSGFPTIEPSTLQLPSLTGRGTSRTTLRVVGDPRYAGKVCVDRVEYPTLPPVALSKLSTTRHGTCVKVAPGRPAKLVFTVNVGATADGRVNGRLHLTLTGAGGKTTGSTVSFTLALARPISATTRSLLFVALLLAGGLAPLALLLALGYRAAAFVHPAGLRVARVRARVFPDGSIRRLEETGASPPFALREDDFGDAGIAEGRTRSFTWRDLRFAARWSKNPFAAPHGEVAARGAYVAASDGILHARRRLTKGRVPLALTAIWVFVLDEDDRSVANVHAVDGTVNVFIAAGASFEAQAPRMMQSLQDFFARLARRIDAAAPPSAPSTNRRAVTKDLMRTSGRA